MSLTAVGTKIISEHRLESYNLSVVLSWFELESWIMDYARLLGVETFEINTKNGKIYHYGIKKIINDFPNGTTISNLASKLHEVRVIRNDIAHAGKMPNHGESKIAIEMFMQMFNIRSGLNLSVDTHPTPSGGM